MVHKMGGGDDKGTQVRWQILFEGGKESRKNPKSKGKEKKKKLSDPLSPNPKP